MEGQKKLSSSHVSIVGIGGTGSSAAELFSRIGIGTLTLIDPDVVAESDLHRQVLYSESDVGTPKVDAASNRLRAENGDLTILKFRNHLDESNAERLLLGSDIIYDGTDNFESRDTLNRVAVRTKTPLIMTSAVDYYGQVKAIIPGVTSCLACIGYPEEGEGENISCSTVGIFPPVLSFVAAFGVNLAVKILLSLPVSGDYYHLDMKSLTVTKITARINERCPVCGSQSH